MCATRVWLLSLSMTATCWASAPEATTVFEIRVPTSRTSTVDYLKWDIAVATSNRVEFLTANGTKLASTPDLNFRRLKDVVLYPGHDQLFVNNMALHNDTVYSVRLDRTNITAHDIRAIFHDEKRVQSLAIDWTTDTLYFSDTEQIKRVSLLAPSNVKDGKKIDAMPVPQSFLHKKGTQPFGLAIDVCGRYLYWVNGESDAETIERVQLDGVDAERRSETIVASSLFAGQIPRGIALDTRRGRVYWVLVGAGRYGAVMSARLDGSDLRTEFSGSTLRMSQIDIAVGGDAIYWTDITGHGLWRLPKAGRGDRKLQVLHRFGTEPHGVVVRDLDYGQEPSCNREEDDMESEDVVDGKYSPGFYEDEDVTIGPVTTLKPDCLGMSDKDGRCDTRVSICHNYCFSGKCSVDNNGQPVCACPLDMSGLRCEQWLCKDWCLNNGECHVLHRGENATCKCRNGFDGERCERSVCPADWCDNGGYCQVKDGNRAVCECLDGYSGVRCQVDDEAVKVQNNSCDDNTATSHRNLIVPVDPANATDDMMILRPEYAASPSSPYEMQAMLDDWGMHLTNPVSIVLLAITAMLLMASMTLSVYVCRLRRRPRIRKRIVVKKNITPLTYRPQSVEPQCEITIENCCNMNVCETPCFEPPNLRLFPGTSSRREEKRTLLTDMEINGADELY